MWLSASQEGVEYGLLLREQDFPFFLPLPLCCRASHWRNVCRELVQLQGWHANKDTSNPGRSSTRLEVESSVNSCSWESLINWAVNLLSENMLKHISNSQCNVCFQNHTRVGSMFSKLFLNGKDSSIQEYKCWYEARMLLIFLASPLCCPLKKVAWSFSSCVSPFRM